MSYKNYTVTYEDRDTYAYVFIRGTEEHFTEAFSLWKAISKYCKGLGYDKVLVEEEINTNFSTAEMYTFASKLNKMGFLDIKLAFVDRKLDDMEENKFGELVAQNRRINIRVFTNIDAAKSWLLSE